MQRIDLATAYGNGVTFVKYVLTYVDLQATSGSGAKTISLLESPPSPGAVTITPSANLVIPKYGTVLYTMVNATTAFAGGSLSAMTTAVGYTGTVAGLIAAQNTFVNTTYAVQRGLATEVSQANFTAAGGVALTATFTPTGDNNSAATAGQVDIYIMIVNPSGSLAPAITGY